MRIQRHSPAALIGIVAAAAATMASAAGLGAGGSGAVLGQPLDFVVQVRLDPGETLEPGCVAAEVMAGERRVPAAQVQARIEAQGGGSARIRVATSSAMDEPVIAIDLGVGCQVRMTRNYIVLADPPDRTPVADSPVTTAPAVAAAPADADALFREPPAPAPLQQVGAAPPPAVAQPAATVLAPAPAPGPTPTPAPTPAPTRATPPPAAPRAAARPERRAEHRAERRVQTGAPAPRPRAPAAEAPRRGFVADPPASLRLDFVEPVPSADAAAVELALEAVAQAASAARA